MRECWLARERLRVSEARSINLAEILTARTDVAAEAAKVAAAEAAVAEAAAAVEAVAAAEAAAAVESAAAADRAASKAAADAPGAEAALSPELPKEPGGGADGMAEDAEEIPGRPVFSVGARVRVLAATAPGILPRLATGCGEAIVTAFDPRTREYTVKALALYSPRRWARLPPRKLPPPRGPPRKPPPMRLTQAALAPELPNEPGGGAGGMAEDAEEIPGRPEELKTRGGSLSS